VLPFSLLPDEPEELFSELEALEGELLVERCGDLSSVPNTRLKSFPVFMFEFEPLLFNL
jgi:hypothetical protein